MEGWPSAGPEGIRRTKGSGWQMPSPRGHAESYILHWKGGRAVDGTGLENRNTLTGIVGSNPTPSARWVCSGHMVRIKFIVQYKGTHYVGWQVQPSGITIQAVLQKKLYQLLQVPINVIGSGRTDSGVHALAQVCHFDLPCKANPRFLKNLKFLNHSLNRILPPDIAVYEMKKVVSTFHSQNLAQKKWYDYFILNSSTPSPFLSDYTWQIPVALDILAMKKAAKILEGKHDFKAFAASDGDAKTSVRKIFQVKISVIKKHPLLGLDVFVQGILHPGSKLIKISFCGNGFLKHMVRNLTGTLVDVGKGKMKPLAVKQILKSRDRKKAGITAPARGLVLRKVLYR